MERRRNHWKRREGGGGSPGSQPSALSRGWDPAVLAALPALISRLAARCQRIAPGVILAAPHVLTRKIRPLTGHFSHIIFLLSSPRDPVEDFPGGAGSG